MTPKIYTKRGDEGFTDLLTGERILKNHPIIVLIGELDELSSSLGIAKVYCAKHTNLKTVLTDIQTKLFHISVEIAVQSKNTYKKLKIESRDVLELENLIDSYSEKLPPLKNFILAGGSLSAAFLHQTRSICRRVERSFVNLIENNYEINPEAIKYINRLSDLLFMLARYVNLLEDHNDDIISGN